MSTLSSRPISLADHHRRRSRSSAVLSRHGSGGSAGGSHGSGGSADGGSSSRWSSRGQHHADGLVSSPRVPQHAPSRRDSCLPRRDAAVPGPSAFHPEGGFDGHAASYGNYDAPSPYCKSGHGASDHGCYAAESHISSYGSRAKRGDLSPAHRLADPNIDLEASFSKANNSRRRRSPSRGSAGLRGPEPERRFGQSPASGIQRSTSHKDIAVDTETWEEESAFYSDRYSAEDDPRDYCKGGATVATASTASSSFSASSSTDDVEEQIRNCIHDAAGRVATHVACFLSFIVGIFLTLLSPFVKIIKLIVGDVRGLLGDAAFLNELGSLWRMYRELRRRGGHSDGDYRRRHRSYSGDRFYDEESMAEADSTVYTDKSSQFVGGWRPSVNSVGSRGSKSGGASRDVSWADADADSSGSSRRSTGSAGRMRPSRSSLSLSRAHEGRYSPEAVRVPRLPLAGGYRNAMKGGRDPGGNYLSSRQGREQRPSHLTPKKRLPLQSHSRNSLV